MKPKLKALNFLSTILFPLLWLDIFSKVLVIAKLRSPFSLAAMSQSIHSLGGFSFGVALSYNEGAAFGLFSQHKFWLFALRVLAIVSIGIYFLYQYPKLKKHVAIALCLILSGAIGNILDIIVFGHVIDFIAFGYQRHMFPLFNVADSCIFLGTILLLFNILKKNPCK